MTLSAQAPALPLAVGAMSVWPLEDGVIALEASVLTGMPTAEAIRLLGGEPAAATPVNAFLVRLPGTTILVDTGMGHDPEEADSGHLLERLGAAGVTPEQVDLVLITHFHLDHLGGLLNPDGTRAFPRAKLCLPRAEHDLWMTRTAELPERLWERIPKLEGCFAPYAAQGDLVLTEDGAALADGVTAQAAPGHTGGHTVYVFRSGAEELWCIGDLIHFAAVQFECPEAGASFDLQPAQAVRTRLDGFRKAAAEGAILAGAHLPRLVRIRPEGRGFRALPVP